MINCFGTILGFATLLITMANSATSQFFSELRRVAVNIQSDTADLQQEIQQPPAEGAASFTLYNLRDELRTVTVITLKACSDSKYVLKYCDERSFRQ